MENGDNVGFYRGPLEPEVPGSPREKVERQCPACYKYKYDGVRCSGCGHVAHKGKRKEKKPSE